MSHSLRKCALGVNQSQSMFRLEAIENKREERQGRTKQVMCNESSGIFVKRKRERPKEGEKYMHFFEDWHQE